MLRVSTFARRVFQAKTVTRNFGAGPAHGHAHADKHGDAHAHDAHHDAHGHDDHHDDHHHEGPHVPEGYDKLGKLCLLTAYLWIFWRIKEDNGQLFGYYQPWLHPHEHVHHHFKSNDVNVNLLVSREEFEAHGAEEEHEEEHDEHDEHDDENAIMEEPWDAEDDE